jgi:hypothetical protein
MPVNDFPATVREVLRSHLTKRALDINPMLLGAGAGAVTGAVLPAEKNKDRLYHALLGAGAGGLGGLGVAN